jgi:ABC-type sugar transport system substrate-binding protein
MTFITRLLAAAGLACTWAAAAHADDIAIAGIVFQQDQYFRGIQLGLEAGAKDTGVTVLQANSESKLEKEAELINTFITRGVKAIVIAPLSADGSLPALKKANDAGVKVVLYGSPLNADFPISSVQTSQALVGQGTGLVAASFIKDKLGGKANVGLLGFHSQLAEMSDARTNGFLEEAKKGNELNIVATQDGFLAEKALVIASDMMTAHPEINVIYSANEGGTVGAVQAVRRAGLAGKVFVFGTDGSEQLGNFLLDEEGILIATTAQQPFQSGKLAMQAAIASAQGKPVEKDVYVPPLPLSRTDKAGVEAYIADVKTLK